MSEPAIPLSQLIKNVHQCINAHAEEVAELDAAIGDGDHLNNLQRGLATLESMSAELDQMPISDAFSKIGMSLMSTMGGASGSLFGSMFVTMGKTAKDQPVTVTGLSEVFVSGVESIKARGKADIGEKTMLDTLIPASQSLQQDAANGVPLETSLTHMQQAAITGMESTKDMLATKGRASFLGERARGHIDAGARTSQLMLCAIADEVIKYNN
ncbi:dihydroxyacetone kinase subunit DhaL [Methylophaga lonarensis]|uniref:dihydroxyacetone kinase subunit DhaL n=1 Tax=Methylophaga lonarensis TaxID=999151 RepID=UPI003D29BEF3